MHTKNVRMRPVPLWGRCTGSTDFTSRKKNTRKTNGATKQHSMRDQRQLWKSFSSSFASFEFTIERKTECLWQDLGDTIRNMNRYYTRPG